MLPVPDEVGPPILVTPELLPDTVLPAEPGPPVMPGTISPVTCEVPDVLPEDTGPLEEVLPPTVPEVPAELPVWPAAISAFP